MILRTIKCSVIGCSVSLTEAKPNSPFPGWGHVVGQIDLDTGEEIAHLCPKHLEMVRNILNGAEVKYDVD